MIVITPATRQVEGASRRDARPRSSRPSTADETRICGFTKMMYDMTMKVVRPATVSARASCGFGEAKAALQQRGAPAAVFDIVLPVGSWWCETRDESPDARRPSLCTALSGYSGRLCSARCSSARLPQRAVRLRARTILTVLGLALGVAPRSSLLRSRVASTGAEDALDPLTSIGT